MKTSSQQLESLLRETPAAARIRRQNAFDDAVAGRRQIVIFGAGNLGRSVLRGLSGTDLEPVAFADNNPRTWFTTIDGLLVLSPQDAANRYSQNAAFVVAVWHPSRAQLMSALLDQLRNLGCHAVPFPLLFWRHSSTFLPSYGICPRTSLSSATTSQPPSNCCTTTSRGSRLSNKSNYDCTPILIASALRSPATNIFPDCSP